MVRRHARFGAERRPRRFAVFSLAALTVLGAAAWMAPTVAVLTSLRDRPLEAAFAGIAGSVSSASARWNWTGSIEYRDVVLRDAAGHAVAIVPEVVIDRGLMGLALSPGDLGTIRLVGPEAVVAVRPGGSSVEDVLAPWLVAPAAATPACTIEVVDGVVEFVDLPRGDAWRVTHLFAAVSLEPGGTVSGWTVGGRLRHAGAAADQGPAAAAAAPVPRRLDRSTVAAGAAAALAHDGGFSCASTADPAAGGRTVAVAAHRLPLGATGVAATRWGSSHVADGLAEVRLDMDVAAGSARIEGAVEAARLAVCRADTLAEVLEVESVELPVDLVVADGRVSVRKLAAVSKLFRAEASGSIRLPTAERDWLEGLVADDFAVAADVDLSAVARALAGGIVVRDDVRVTDGHLEIAAAARADGDGRLLEVRCAARDLAAEQAVAAADGGTSMRPLRWTEPFTTWLKVRRGPAGGLRIDEARLTSAALEVTAVGTPQAATLEWTLDCARLREGAAEVIDLAGVALAGRARGRVELERATATGPSRVAVVADLEDFEWALPGRPAWRDEALAIEAEATGSATPQVVAIEAAHATVTGGDDRLEVTLAGGTLVELAALAAGRLGIRPASSGAAAAADIVIAGDLGRWHARLAALVPATAGRDVGLSGRVKATAAVVARGSAWEITRAGAEIERLGVAWAGTRISEPRLVASVAGLVRPGERIDVASAELLTATVSLRTAGLTWRPAATGVDWLDRLRGKVQWQADVGRLERWFLDPETCGRWPATGRAWGTFELADGPDGVDVVCEATGSQLAVAEVVAAPAGQPPRPVWAEPQATVALEFALPRSAPADVRITRLDLESSLLAVRARGGLGGRPRVFEVDGTMAYDLGKLSQLVAPWTGGLVNLAGSGGRPFTIRGRVGGETSGAAAEPQADVATLPLPEDWVAAARAGSTDDAATANVARPVAATTRRSVDDLVRGLALDTSLAWQAGEVAGFRLDAGEIPVRLLEGQLAFGPFDLGVSGGRLRGAPWMSLAAAPREVVVPGGRALDRVAIGDAQARRLVAWVSPLVGHSTHTSGFVTADLAGARLPLADPFTGVAEGQLVFDEFEVTPAGGLAPLVNLVAKLQAAVDPRLAFGDRPVLMRVRPDPVRLRLVERRLWHEGLVLDAGQLAVRSAGSVGADGTLAMVVEVALRGDVAGQTPIVAQLLRTPLVIPLKGTVERPELDARAIDMTLARIVENTAQAVIGDGIVRGLDALLGGQQPAPAPAPAPLVLPPGP